jgi:hypothetical protein
MKGTVMRGNPRLNPYVDSVGALDELKPSARRSTASLASIRPPGRVNRMLHKL